MEDYPLIDESYLKNLKTLLIMSDNNEIKNIDILKVNIIMNVVKIVSLWLTTLILTSKGTLIAVGIKDRIVKYDGYEVRIDTLEKWKKDFSFGK